MGKEGREGKKERKKKWEGSEEGRRKRKTTFTSFHTHEGFEKKWPFFSFTGNDRGSLKNQEIYV